MSTEGTAEPRMPATADPQQAGGLPPNIYSVAPNGLLWQVSHSGEVLSQHVDRDEATRQVDTLAAADRPSQVLVTDANGQVVSTGEFPGV